MKKNRTKQPRYRLLKAGCVSAGLLSISNPTQVTAADIGILDVHNFSVSLGTILNPFPNSPLGVHVAVGDLDGDGFGDIVMGPGRGEASVAIWRKKIDKVEIHLLDSTSQKGVRVATGDLDGDGTAETIVATPATGRSSALNFAKFTFEKGAAKFTVSPAFDDIFEGFAGGVSVAVGDIGGDGVPDIVAAKAGCPDCFLTIKKYKPTLDKFFRPYEPALPPGGFGGLEVAMGDIDGVPDSNGNFSDEVLVLPNDLQAGPAMGPLLQKGKEKWIEIQGWDWEIEAEGVHVAMGDVNGDGLADLVAGSPRGTAPIIKLYSFEKTPGMPGAPGTLSLTLHKVYDDFYDSSFLGGVRVAVGDINGDGFGDIVFAPGGVPEPATIASLFTAFGAWLLGSRRRRRKTPPG